jgi:hypothetical protein
MGGMTLATFSSVVGITAVAIVFLKWVYGQVRGRKEANRFVGVWTLWDFRGRDLVPRVEESITVISPQPWWRFKPYALTVQARDLRDEQDHEGYINIDPSCPNRGARTVSYKGRFETTQQRLELGPDGAITVFQTEAGYNPKHVLRPSGLLGIR